VSLSATLQTLLESHGELYHVTSLRALWKIVADDLFELSYGRGDSEIRHGDEGFFISFSRVPNNRYRKGSSVTIVVDWDKLRQRYKLRPVDYWGWGGETESEERLFSAKPAIRGFRQYIKAVHVKYFEQGRRDDFENLTLISEFPVYMYDNQKAYELLDTRRAKTPEEFMKGVPEQANPPHHFERGERELVRMDDLLKFLESGAKIRTEPWYRRLLYYHSDFITQMGADVHNMRSHKGIAVRGYWERWEKLLKQYGAKTITEFAKKFVEQHKQRQEQRKDKR
jgi:hypothetical protein